MKSFILFILVVLLCNSCSTFKSNTSQCDKEVKNSLKSISRYISMDKNTKVYTVLYSKLPDIDKDRFEKLRDYLYYTLYIQADTDDIKHYLFSKQIEKILIPNCEISVESVRKYFGQETIEVGNYDKIRNLFYYFNPASSKNCDSSGRNPGPHPDCSLLTFQFDENQILTNINTASFKVK